MTKNMLKVIEIGILRDIENLSNIMADLVMVQQFIITNQLGDDAN
jgi:hypothetical protein